MAHGGVKRAEAAWRLPTTPTPGAARLEVELVAGASAVVSSFASAPMKLLAPKARGKSVWAFTSSFGGGLVAGDQTRLDLRLGEGTVCHLGTQASTKVYRNPKGLPCGHETLAEVGAGATLVFCAEPVQAFAGSHYRQRQRFELAGDASLVLLDWFTSGRPARGERWGWEQFESRNEVAIGGVLVFADAVFLRPAEGPLGAAHRLGRHNCFAMLACAGPAAEPVARLMPERFSSAPPRPGAELAASVSARRGVTVARLAAPSVEAAGRELRELLRPLADLLGDDPWARKW